MKKYSYLIIIVLISSLVFAGCSLLSNISQVPATEQSGITYLTKNGILYPELVGLWRFDDNNADDSSGYDNHGIVYGAADYVDSPMGQALSFDGLNDYVEVQTKPSLQLSSKGTIEFWFNPGIGFGGHDAFILKGVATGTGGATDLDYGVNRHSNDGSIKGWISDHSGVDIIYTTTKTWTVGEWYHIAFTWNGDELQIYVNGVSDATPVSQTRDANVGTDPITMGRIRAHWYNGLLDEVRIWNTALTADQLIIYDGYSGLLAPYVEPPKAFKIGRSIPLKWQYTDLFGAAESSAANPSVEIKQISNGDIPAEGNPIVVDDPGNSGYQYDSDTKTWQFNWQTKGREAGDYNIWIVNDWTGQTFGPIEIRLR